MISIPWQEVVRGSGISRPLDSSLYGEEDFPWIYGAQALPRSRTLGTSPQAHREICMLDLSGRIRRGGPIIQGYGDQRVDTMILIRCRLILIDFVLYHGIQGCIGACSGVHRYAEGHDGAQWCVLVCRFALGCRRSGSHPTPFPYSMIDASIQEG